MIYYNINVIYNRNVYGPKSNQARKSDQASFQKELKCSENLTEKLNAKDAENSIKSFKNIEANVMPLIVAFSEF